MSVRSEAGPRVSEDAVEFSVAEPRLGGVALLHELRRPRRVEFMRDGATWRLTFPRPQADRLEYLLELTHRTGRREVMPDAQNPRRAPGAFGEKSVIEFPGYELPEWAGDEDAAAGSLHGLPLESARLRTTVPA